VRRVGAWALGRIAILVCLSGCALTPPTAGPGAPTWEISAARAIERSQHLPAGSVSVDTFTQTWYGVDSARPARHMVYVMGGPPRYEYDYSRTEGLPVVFIRLSHPATIASGWLEGRYGEAEMTAAILIAWKFVPVQLPTKGAELGIVIGDEGEGGMYFSREHLDSITPRHGLTGLDILDSAVISASVIIEGTLDSVVHLVAMIDSMPVIGPSFFVVRPTRVWRGTPGYSVRIKADPNPEDETHRWEIPKVPRQFPRDSVFLLYLSSPDRSGIFSVVRKVSGPAIAVERTRLAQLQARVK
jgi:hypothetical protein